MQINNYEYILITEEGQTEVFPLGEKDFKISYDRDGINYKKKLSGTLILKGKAFYEIMKIERSQSKCKDVRLEIYEVCNSGQRRLKINARIELNSGEFDLDRCMVSLKFERENIYQCLETGKNIEVNLFEKVNHDKIVNLVDEEGQIEEVEFNYTSNRSPFIRGETMLETAQRIPTEYRNKGYVVKSWKAIYTRTKTGTYTYEGETEYFITIIRKVVVTGCDERVPSYYILGLDNCATEGNRTWYIKPNPISQKLVKADDIGIKDFEGTWEYNYKAEFIGVDDLNISIDNGMKFNDVLISIFGGCFPNFRSDFFQINVPEGEETEINYITGVESYTNELLLFQRSDVVRYEDNFENATIAKLKPKDLFEWLSSVFNVGYGIVNGIFRIEHENFFRNIEVIDLTTSGFKKHLFRKRKYKYDAAKFPAYERFLFDLQGSELWERNEINYLNCNVTDSELTEEYKAKKLTTDVNWLLYKSEQEENSTDLLKGFVLIAGKENEDGTYNSIKGNSVLSWFHLIKDFHFHNRPQRFGNFDGFEYQFNSTSLSMIGEKISIPFCGCEDFKVFSSYKTELGIGQINSADVSLSSGFVTLEIAYPYDNLQEEGTYNRRPIIYPEYFVTEYGNEINELIRIDDDGQINEIIIVTEPVNGTLSIVSQNGSFYINYVGNDVYIGNDSFEIKAVDDGGRESVAVLYGVEITESSGGDGGNGGVGYPILNYDEFSTNYPNMGTEYYVGNILSNDDPNSTNGQLTVISYKQRISRRDEEDAEFRIESNGDMYVKFIGCPHSFVFQYTAENDDGFQSTQTGKHNFNYISGRPC